MYQSNLLRRSLCTGVSILAIAPFLATGVGAFPGGFSRGGGGGIPGGGFSRGISGGSPGGFSHGIGGAAPMIHSAPMGGAGGGQHSLSAIGALHTYTGPHIYSTPHSSTFAIRHSGEPSTFSRLGDSRLAGRTGHNLPDGALSQHGVQKHLNGQLANNRLANQNWTTRSLHGVGQASVLRSGTFASLGQHNTISRSLTGTTFRGRFAGQNWKLVNGGWFWRHRHPIIAIGWFGPLFWPYAYDDFIDYTFWPYAYDVFWPYVYDDLYVGVFGPYSYEGPTSRPSTSSRRATTSRSASVTAAEVCREQVPALTGWPIQQIAQTVQPDQAQQAALDGLKGAAGEALDLLHSACPNELPSTPIGRLSAMRKRIEVMSQALAIVQPALSGFYDLLNDEQKSRFNALTPETRPTTHRGKQLPDLAQVCSGQAVKPTNVPTERIEQIVHPTDTQRVLLQALNDASAKAADYLKANCSAEEALTPPGRVAAMAQRLNAMLEAIKIVQPTLENFYGGLTDEQKARFNQLGAPQS